MTDAPGPVPDRPRRGPRLSAPLGRAPPPEAGHAGGTWLDRAALVATSLWLGVVAYVVATVDGAVLQALVLNRLVTIIGLLAVVLPLAVLWLAAAVARQAVALQAEADALRAELDALREAHAVQARMGLSDVERRLESRIERVAAMKTAGIDPERAPGDRSSAGAGPPPAPRAPRDRAVALPDVDETVTRIAPFVRRPGAVTMEDPAPVPDPEPPTPLDADETLRALDFPRDQDDADGFALARRALADPDLGPLLRAAQQVAAALAEDGVAADRLDPPAAAASAWRDWLEGADPRPVLGALAAPGPVAKAAARLGEDEHFAAACSDLMAALRAAGPVLAVRLSDVDLAELDRTRTGVIARLVGRVTGALPSPPA